MSSQNIFIVQKNPSWWVKIGDFGIAKRVREDDTTELRTATGTQGYEAPEIRGYVEVEEDTPSSVYTNAVDMWSFGCVIYKVVAKHVPFPNGREIKRFCDSRISFPAQPLQAKLTTDGINFLQSILVVKPLARPTAEVALQHPWLLSHDGYVDLSPQLTSELPDGEGLSASIEAREEKNSDSIVISPPGDCTVYITALSDATTEKELIGFFDGYLVQSIEIIKHSVLSQTTSYAVAELCSPSDAKRAVAELSGKEILGHSVGLQLAKPETAGGKAESNARPGIDDSQQGDPGKAEKDQVKTGDATVGGHGDLNWLRDNPQFQQLAQVIQKHPQMLEPAIQSPVTGNPQLAQPVVQYPDQLIQPVRDRWSDDWPLARRAHEAAKSAPREEFDTELELCKKVWVEIMKPKYQKWTSPFMNPNPDDFKFMGFPINLSIIGTRLNSGLYESSRDFEADFRQIFVKCYKYYGSGDDLYRLCKNFELIFDYQWAKKFGHTTYNDATPPKTVEYESEEHVETSSPIAHSASKSRGFRQTLEPKKIASQHPWPLSKDEYVDPNLQQGSELSDRTEAKIENNNDDSVLNSSAKEWRLFVGNLSFDTTKRELMDFFRGYTVDSLSITKYPMRNGTRVFGYALVQLSTASEAKRAIAELDGAKILDSKVNVQLACSHVHLPSPDNTVSASIGRSRTQQEAWIKAEIDQIMKEIKGEYLSSNKAE
jgi:RNA recognition motif-containing protein